MSTLRTSSRRSPQFRIGGTRHGDTNAFIVTSLTIIATLTSLYDLLLVLVLSGR